MGLGCSGSMLPLWLFETNFPHPSAPFLFHSSSVPDSTQISSLGDISLVPVPLCGLPFSITCSHDDLSRLSPHAHVLTMAASTTTPRRVYLCVPSTQHTAWYIFCPRLCVSECAYRPTKGKPMHIYEMQAKTLTEILALPPTQAHLLPAVPLFCSLRAQCQVPSSGPHHCLPGSFLENSLESALPAPDAVLCLFSGNFCSDAGKHYLSWKNFRIYSNSLNSIVWVPRPFII